jgi:uncharacterized protein
VPISKLYISLFGGEPRLQKNTIFYFADGMYDIARKYNCEIIYSMTSNMTLLDDDIIALIKKYKISTQVSIDGTRSQHDIRRIKRNGAETYDTIINNLKRLKDNGLKNYIIIRLNIDNENLDDAELILSSVCEYSDDVYFGFLDTFKGFNDSYSKNCISNEIYPEIVLARFDEMSKKYNFNISRHFGKQSPCTLSSENCFYIDCYLNVYKCEMLLNQPIASVGKIVDEGKFIPNTGFYHQMNHSPELFPECLKCKLLPLCAGGCAGKAYIAAGKDDGVLNEKYCMFSEESLKIYLKDFVLRLS